MADDFDNADETIISRRKSEPVDDRTAVSSRKAEPVDDRTVVSSRNAKVDPLNDDTVIVGSPVDDDATIITRGNPAPQKPVPDNDETVITGGASRAALPDDDDTVIVLPTSPASPNAASRVGSTVDDATVIAGGRTPVEPGAVVGNPTGLQRESEREVEVIERTDFGTPPPRAPRSTDPAAVYERTMKRSKRRARTVALLLLASAVVIGIVVAVAIVTLVRG